MIKNTYERINWRVVCARECHLKTDEKKKFKLIKTLLCRTSKVKTKKTDKRVTIKHLNPYLQEGKITLSYTAKKIYFFELRTFHMIFLDCLYTVTKTFFILYIFVVKQHELRIKQIQTMSRLMRGTEPFFYLGDYRSFLLLSPAKKTPKLNGKKWMEYDIFL